MILEILNKIKNKIKKHSKNKTIKPLRNKMKNLADSSKNRIKSKRHSRSKFLKILLNNLMILETLERNKYKKKIFKLYKILQNNQMTSGNLRKTMTRKPINNNRSKNYNKQKLIKKIKKIRTRLLPKNRLKVMMILGILKKVNKIMNR